MNIPEAQLTELLEKAADVRESVKASHSGVTLAPEMVCIPVNDFNRLMSAITNIRVHVEMEQI